MKNNLLKLKYFLHRVRIFGYEIFRIKPTRMGKLIRAILLELRILILTIAIVIGFSIFAFVTDDPQNESNFIIKINGLIIMVILWLMFRVLFKLNKKINTQTKNKIGKL